MAARFARLTVTIWAFGLAVVRGAGVATPDEDPRPVQAQTLVKTVKQNLYRAHSRPGIANATTTKYLVKCCHACETTGELQFEAPTPGYFLKTYCKVGCAKFNMNCDKENGSGCCTYHNFKERHLVDHWKYKFSFDTNKLTDFLTKKGKGKSGHKKTNTEGMENIFFAAQAEAITAALETDAGQKAAEDITPNCNVHIKAHAARVLEINKIPSHTDAYAKELQNPLYEASGTYRSRCGMLIEAIKEIEKPEKKKAHTTPENERFKGMSQYVFDNTEHGTSGNTNYSKGLADSRQTKTVGVHDKNALKNGLRRVLLRVIRRMLAAQ